MASAMPWPWCAPRSRTRRTRRSSVPWSRESRDGSVLVGILPEYSSVPVECQLERADPALRCYLFEAVHTLNGLAREWDEWSNRVLGPADVTICRDLRWRG